MAIIIRAEIKMDAVNRNFKKLDGYFDSVSKKLKVINDLLKDTSKLADDAAASLAKMQGPSGRSTSAPRGRAPSNPGNGGPSIADQYQQYAQRRMWSSAFRQKFQQQNGGAPAKYVRDYLKPIGPGQYSSQYDKPIGPPTARIGGRVPPRYGQSGAPSIADPYQAYANRRTRNQQFRDQFNKQNGPSLGKRFMDTLSSSRIDSKGNLMPLVGKLFGLFSRLPLVGKVIEAGLAVTAAKLRMATEFMGNLRGSAASGGMGGGIANLAFQGGLGINPGGIGRNLGSGFGPMAAAGAGVNPLGGPFGDNNYNEKGLKVLDWIRRSRSYDEARRRAEMVGSPEAANVKLLTGGTYNQLRSAGGEPSKGGMVASAELSAQWSVLMTNLNKLVATDMAPLMAGLSLVLRGLNIVITPLVKIADFLDHLLPHNDDHKKAIDRNTDAVDNNTKSINQGIYGGGPRAGGAIPSRQQQPGYSAVNPYTPYGIM